MPLPVSPQLVHHRHRPLQGDAYRVEAQHPVISRHEEGPRVLVLVVQGGHVDDRRPLWQEDHVACSPQTAADVSRHPKITIICNIIIIFYIRMMHI